MTLKTLVFDCSDAFVEPVAEKLLFKKDIPEKAAFAEKQFVLNTIIQKFGSGVLLVKAVIDIETGQWTAEVDTNEAE